VLSADQRGAPRLRDRRGRSAGARQGAHPRGLCAEDGEPRSAPSMGHDRGSCAAVGDRARGSALRHGQPPMGKKAISQDLINTCYRVLGLKETVVFADQLMYWASEYSDPLRCLHRRERHGGPAEKKPSSSSAPRKRGASEIEEQYAAGLVTHGERTTRSSTSGRVPTTRWPSR
jgi:hypothetical protein